MGSEAHKRVCSLGGQAVTSKVEWKDTAKKGGNAHVESGHINKLNTKIHTCPHRNKDVKGQVYFRWHGDNCKDKI